MHAVLRKTEWNPPIRQFNCCEQFPHKPVRNGKDNAHHPYPKELFQPQTKGQCCSQLDVSAAHQADCVEQEKEAKNKQARQDCHTPVHHHPTHVFEYQIQATQNKNTSYRKVKNSPLCHIQKSDMAKKEKK